jgi:2-oxoglutarate ferredoxin oxidoreductase subunit delta
VAKGRVSIVVERCKACGFCVEFCPTKVLALSSAFNSKGYHPPHVVAPEKCSGCDLCGMYCPDFAIYGHRTDEKKKSEQPRVEKTAPQAKLAKEKSAREVQP